MSGWPVRRAGLLLGGALSLLALGPLLLTRGYTLTVDMVFVPHPPLWRGLLGLDGRVPRAVPSDGLVALLSVPLPSDVVQKLLLGLTPVLAATGTVRLVRLLLPDLRLPAALAAAALVVWNPYVAERLALGQWAVLIGLAALPWVVVGAAQVRAGTRGGWPVLILALAAGALTPTGGLVATVVAGAALWGAPKRREPARLRSRAVAVPALLAAAALLNAPWWLPSLLLPGGVAADPSGLAVFAARSDSPLGLVGSLLTLGGVWDPGAVPAGRDSGAGVVGPLVILGLVAAGAYLAARRRALPVGLLVVATAGVLVALAGAGGLLDSAVRTVPALALLRDGSRLLGPLVVGEALLLAVAVDAVIGQVARPARLPSGVLAVVLPVLALPGLALALDGRLGTVEYPADWAVVRSVLDGSEGAVLSLPWDAYRQPGWNGSRTVLDPAVKAFGRRAVVDDSLEVAGVRVPGEDPVAATLGPRLRAGVLPPPPVLREAGVGWVLVSDGAAVTGLGALEAVHQGPVLALYRVPGRRLGTVPVPPVLPVALTDLAAGLTVLAAGAATLRRRRT